MKTKNKKSEAFVKIVGMEFEDSLSYIKESRKFIYFCIYLFLVFVVFGFVFADYLSPYINKLLQELLKEFDNLRWYEYILKIFLNNLEVSIYSLIPFLSIIKIASSGILAALAGIVFMPILFLTGIIPVAFDATNAITLGYVFARAYDISGFSDFWRILPHGIFELPAVFISLGLGLKLSLFLFSKNPKKEFLIRLENSIRVLFFVIVPLLIIAAIIEGLLIAILG